MNTSEITHEEIKELLSYTDGLMQHMFWFSQDFSLKPSKNHRGVSIAFSDIIERRSDFTKELVNTVVSWVYSRSECDKIFNDRYSCTKDSGNAAAHLATLAFRKFRPGYPQGQFGELVLFNLIQHFFGAVPLLRKMNITTSTSLERFGADAIHYKKEGTLNKFFLGEAKCYTANSKFKEAFKKSLDSISKTFTSFFDELELYTYSDFIDSNLQRLARELKNNELKKPYFELICIIIYNENKYKIGTSEGEIKKNIEEIVSNRCSSISDDMYESIKEQQLSRINYIIFPIWELESLLSNFHSSIGRES